MNKRIDLHTHSLFSDGELLPSELVRRAYVLDHEAIAITDHIDASNLDIIPKVIKAIDDIQDKWDILAIPGAEITHAPSESIPRLAKEAKELGAKIIVVHGETIVEPVIEGTNHIAVNCPDIDVLGHPGLITIDDAETAKENNIALEISARAGHSLSNGHVAKIAREVGADLIIDTDTHAPNDLINYEMGYKIGLAAGLNDKEVAKALLDNPMKILKNKGLL